MSFLVSLCTWTLPTSKAQEQQAKGDHYRFFFKYCITLKWTLISPEIGISIVYA